MKERPILFSAAMVRAILDGRKTQTRRVIKYQPSEDWRPEFYGELHKMKNGEFILRKNEPVVIGWGPCNEEGDAGYNCPYGQPGTKLWVRESLIWVEEAGHPAWAYSADWAIVRGGSAITSQQYKIPSIHMPRIASRITLEITGVRVERLQDITANEALAEGTPDLRTIENGWDMKRCFQEL